MNMLIAIMGDTYERVSSNKNAMGLREKIVIMLQTEWCVDLDTIFGNATYVFIVRRKQSMNTTGAQSEDDPQAW